MRSAIELLVHLRELGARVTVVDGRMRVRAEKGVLTDELRAELASHKEEILALLSESPAAAEATPPVPRRSGEQDAPLSFAQQRLWFVQKLHPEDSSYHIARAHRLEGPLDVEALRGSLLDVVERHEVLRTTLPSRRGKPVQRIGVPESVALDLQDLASLDDSAAEAQRRFEALARKPFDLEREPPIRTALMRLGESDHVIVIVLHHVGADGWSLAVLHREISESYGARLGGAPAKLPDLPVQMADFARQERERLQGERLEKDLAYWKSALAGVAPLELPMRKLAPDARTRRAGRESFAWPAEIGRALDDLARRNGTTLFVSLLTAFQALLHRYSGQDDVVVGTPVSARNKTELEGLIGCFVDLLLLRGDLAGDPTFAELLVRVRECVLGAFRHQELPYDKIVEALAPERARSRNPLIQATLALQSMPHETLQLAGVAVCPFGDRPPTSRFDLEWHLNEAPGRLEGDVVYDADFYDSSTVVGMIEHLRVLIEGAISSPDTPVSRLPLLSPEEHRRLTEEWNDTAATYPRDRTVHGLFAEQAARSPDAIALAYQDERVTYSDLDARANRLAHHLQALGVGAETRVGICVERSVDSIVGVLAILKAGGAYVPLDPDDPAARLALKLEDAQVPVLLTHAALEPDLPPFSGRLVRLDADAAEIAAHPSTAPVCEQDARGLAYVIYTSGSTGRPKGVCVEHRGIVRLVRDTDYVDLGPDDAVIQFAPMSFDAATFEIWGALLNGGRIIGVEKDVGLAPGRLAEVLREQGVTTMFVTTALFNQLVRQMPDVFASLDTLLFGGEAVTPRWVREVLDKGRPRHLLHVYGPTECTTFSTWHEVEHVAEAATTVPIGRRIAHSTTYVLDERLQPVPVGVPGRLWCGGDGVAREYLGDPELTGEKFVPDPFCGDPAARIYDTGDDVRWLADGTLEFIGRRDGQVKLHGFRIELGEIESVLSAHPCIAEVVAVASESQPGEKRLVAYAVPEGGALPNTPELRAHVLASLPEYMVPAAFVAMDALPLSPTGKVDRRALPEPDASRPELDVDWEAPSGSFEQGLARIWSSALGVESVGAQDDFFQLGGHSLLAAQLVAEVRDAFGIELPLADVFSCPTVREQARRIEELKRDTSSASAAPLLAIAKSDGDLPLSFQQQRLWFLHEMDPKSAAYNVPFARRLLGALDVSALHRALQVIVARHETLRTTFETVDGAPRQRIAPELDLDLPVEDLRGLDAEQREAAVVARVREDRMRPFDLAAGPLLRAGLLRLDEEEHVLLLSMHHIVCDVGSLGVIFREVAEAYGAHIDGRVPTLPEVPLQYADYARWQRAWMEGEALARPLAHWREVLGPELPTLELPTDHPRPRVPSFRGGTCVTTLGADELRSLRKLGSGENASLFMVLVAAFEVLLSRHAGQSDFLIGTPILGRRHTELEGTVGIFLDTVVLRADLSGDPSFRELLGRVQSVALDAFEHAELPFEKLVEELQPERDTSRHPLFQVLCSLVDGAEGVDLRLPSLSVEHVAEIDTISKFDLSLDAQTGPNELSVRLNFATDLFEPPTIERMLAQLERVLRAIAIDADQKLSELPLIDDAESARLMELGRGPVLGEPPARRLHDLFEAQAKRTPDAVAVSCGDQRLTYGELETRSRLLANRLRSRGVGPNVRVGLCVERGVDLVVGLLGILRAGGAYVPLDAAFPEERRRAMLGDSRAPVLVTQRHLAAASAFFAGTLLSIDDDAAEDAEPPIDAPVLKPGPEDLAYVIYTSGSTGKPKGVEIPHGAVVAFHAAMRREPGVDARDVLLAVTTISFDIAGLELLLPLGVGARVEIAPRDVASDGRRLARALRDSGATILQATPATWQMLLHADWKGDGCLKMLCGGEALKRSLARQLLERGGELWNLYGPTETTIWSAVARVTSEEANGPDDEPVTIGRPIVGTNLYVLDDRLRPVPQGVPGELCIAGAGLASGYSNDSERTAERFVSSPWPEREATRLYRTGDRARFDASGMLRFLGRTDHQIKLRGHRIEAGEIEAALEQHPDVAQAVVILRDEAGGDSRLVAYLHVREESAPAVAELRELLRASLPEYMVPSAFVHLDALPLSTSGKVDRKRLAAIRPAELEASSVHAAPRGPVEEAMATAFAELLASERVGALDDFFELGGHSLLAARLVSRIRGIFDVEIPLSDVFEWPTVSGLAERVEEARRSGRTPLPPIVPVPRDRPLPLSFAQQRLWFLDQLGTGTAYHLRLDLGLTGPLDRAALERSLNAILERHEALRTRFVMVDGTPAQIVDASRTVPLKTVDRLGIAEEDRPAAMHALALEDVEPSLDLAHGLLLRATLVRFGNEEHALAVTVHHVVVDGWSFGILVDELAAHYSAFAAGGEPELSPLPVQYADYATWQRERVTDEVLAEPLAYWMEKLGGDLPEADLPADRPRPAMPTFGGASHRFSVDESLSERLHALAHECGVTMAMLLSAAFQSLIARYTGRDEVVIGSPVANRSRAEIEGLIGFFVNSLVLRTDVSGDPTFGELLRRVQQTSLEAYDHQDVPFDRIVDEVAPERDLSSTPIFQIVVAVHQRQEPQRDEAGLEMRVIPTEVVSTRHDLEVHLFEGAEGIDGNFVYATDLFDSATIARMAGHFENLLAGIADVPDARLSELPLLGEEEQQRLLEWNRTAVGEPETEGIHRVFEARVAEQPDAVALVHRGRETTYDELNRRSNRVAHVLQSMGVGPDVLVGLSAERGTDRIVGLLGILKAGGAYLPLDPEYPRERLAFMLEDAGVPVLVTQERLLDVLPAHDAHVLCLDRDHASFDAASDANPTGPSDPSHLAYAIYTSGSTGRPKAALLEHRGLCNVAQEQARTFGVGAGSRVLQFASFSFDAATFEVAMALPQGGTLVLADSDEILPGPDLLTFLRDQRVEVVTLPPTALAATSFEELPNLSTITVAGEACPAELVSRWAPGRRFFNLYGPTEATIWSTVAELRAGDESHIGRPIGNTTIHLIDSHSNPVPVGVPGELCIGGVGLARGYHRRPELTAERFVRDPFDPSGASRLYRSGDLARRRSDGMIEFLGRIDHQIKLRGHRIELGEIEAELDRHPSVRASLALVREDVPGDRRLVAYVVHDPAGEAEAAPVSSWEEEHVSQWRTLYEQSYGEAETPEERTFHIASWNSSYTGGAIPAEEMREWVDLTVEGILETRPRRVLEIGCGTGLLLSRIAPRCDEYLGIDFSQAALDHVESLRPELDPDGTRIRLERRAAHDLAGVPDAHFDTVVINSVAQYFPSAEYLARVLEEAARTLRPGGSMFVGDVRSLPLLRAFHASVQLFGADDDADIGHLRQRVHQQANQDQELVVAPSFFSALSERVPRIRRVAIEPKRGRYDNELSRFRYDAVLTLDEAPSTVVVDTWLDASERGFDVEAVRDALQSDSPEWLGVRNVRNARTVADVIAADLLERDDAPATVGAFRSERDRLSAQAFHPDDLREACTDLPYSCAVSWAAGRPDGAFEVVYRRHAQDGTPVDPWDGVSPPAEARGAGAITTNHPLQGRLLRELVPRLREHVGAALPSYMVPSAFVVLDAFPVTPNGKIDRRALPAPESLRPELAGTEDAPTTEAEEVLAAIWARTLNLERVGVSESFFELGGDSILSIQVVSAAREAGLHFTAKDLFQHPTVSALSKVAALTPVMQAEQGLVTGPVPLTPIQRWFLDQEPEDIQHFNQAFHLRCRTPVEESHLRDALGLLLRHHDALRLRLTNGPRGWEQIIVEPDDEIPLVTVDLKGASPEERARVLREEAELAQASLDAYSGPLLRAVLFSSDVESDASLLLVVHHLAVDVVSWHVLLEDLESALSAARRGSPASLPPKTTSFREWATRLVEHAQGTAIAEQARIWLDLPWHLAPDLPRDEADGDNSVASLALVTVAMDAAETRKLLQVVPRVHDARIDEALVSALSCAIGTWAGGDHVLIDLEGHGREEVLSGVDLSRTVGWFTSMFPVLLDVSAEDDPVSTLSVAKEQLRRLPDRGMAFGVARYLADDELLVARLAALPQARVAFNYLGQLDGALGDDRALSASELPTGAMRAPSQQRHHELEVNAGVLDGSLSVTFGYSAALHRSETIQRVADDFVRLLRKLLESGGDPSLRVSDVSPFGWGQEELEDILGELEDPNEERAV